MRETQQIDWKTIGASPEKRDANLLKNTNEWGL